MGDLKETQEQLSMINAALRADPENAELQQLKTDLETLIQLTKQSMGVVDTKKGTESDPIFCDDDEDEGDNDDIQILQETNDDIQIVQEKEGKSLEDEMKNLEGVKVSAPYSTNYRGVSFHNAVIFSVESQEIENFEDIIVRVVYSHPIETGMVPCKHFLHGRCNRDDEDCKWSHGEKVNLSELREWEEGDWSGIKKGTVVLTQQETGVWARARVQDIDGDDLVLKLEGSNLPAVTGTLEQVFPLSSTGVDLQGEKEKGNRSYHEGDNDSDELDSSKQEDELDTFVPVEISVATSTRLGEWEDYTRGMASKLMAKMGWSGGGLGKEGEGRLEPVPVTIYPEGKSLDWCMERRQMADNGQNIADVEKSLKKRAKEEAKKSELRARKEKERDSSAKSLFDLINVKLGGKRTNISDMFGGEGKKTADIGGSSKGGGGKTTLKAASNEKLKVENFKIGEKIRTIKKDIARLEESYTRHSGKDNRTAATIKSKINEKKQELFRLESCEAKLSAEQGNRKTSAKLTIF
eukprot:TRINITY_DN5922_c0_g1_i11.p1 TRINITY_DN5922_c0_g1~~TRINITY_DN5922_c0_g1_i11.p1  ORF type:complete len:522 (-),score=128.05 TRINITY_DN5922_c0_g1_i11:159-1724(-)